VIDVVGAAEHNLKNIDVQFERRAITVVTGVSGSGKSSLVFDTVLAEAQRRFFYTLSHYSRQFLDLGFRPKVRRVRGLSPAISLAQNETEPSRRASVGSLTDISELIGVLYARFGVQHCPHHKLQTQARTVADIVAQILAKSDGDTLNILAQVAVQKKGIFRKELARATQLGYTKAFVDGKLIALAGAPDLAKDQKHSIYVVIDVVKIKADAVARLQRAITSALELGEGFGGSVSAQQTTVTAEQVETFSTFGGCPTCGFTWPKLDARYFNPNSLGRCEVCAGYGLLHADPESEEEEDNFVPDVSFATRCEECDGSGVAASHGAILLRELSIQTLLNLPIHEIAAVLAARINRAEPSADRLFTEVASKLQRIVAIGLGYLSLSRRVWTLSPGEAQRLRLASLMTESLTGVLYILDEPSQGLHPTELDALWRQLTELRDAGNTLILVDHDERLMHRADWIIDLGPSGGQRGGQLMAKFRPADAAKHRAESVTAELLCRRKSTQVEREKRKAPQQFLQIVGARTNNLQSVDAKIALGAMTAVSGVSGAGKSSLILHTLWPSLVRFLEGGPMVGCSALVGAESLVAAELVDRRKMAKSSASMPATYMDIFTPLRDLFAATPAAQIAGLTAKDFSLAGGKGRCSECRGRGEIVMSMRFLADSRSTCPVCNGKRYGDHLDDIRYNNLSLAEVLKLTLDETAEVFQNQRKIMTRLSPALALGLGYLHLGQPSSSLSGGESQRLRLVPYLSKTRAAGHLLILDEPTIGLHSEDVKRLLTQLRLLTERGVTVVVIEHNSDVIAAADWQIEVGPGAAEKGGKIVFEGVPK
jgi:excinuclease ABC subunit A